MWQCNNSFASTLMSCCLNFSPGFLLALKSDCNSVVLEKSLNVEGPLKSLWICKMQSITLGHIRPYNIEARLRRTIRVRGKLTRIEQQQLFNLWLQKHGWWWQQHHKTKSHYNATCIMLVSGPIFFEYCAIGIIR